MTLPFSWSPRRKHIRRCLILITILLAVWLSSSLGVAYKLTRRRRPPFPEPIPHVIRDKLVSYRFQTRDGQEIGAWFAAGKDDAPSVLLLHGNGGSRWNSRHRASILAEEGCAVLLISLRAHGDSTGEFNDIGYSARHDVIAAVEFLEHHRPAKSIVIDGVSMGAATAVFASGELAHRVRGYILESPYQDLRIAVRNRTENALPPVLDWVANQGLSFVAPLFLPHLDQISPIRAIDGIPDDVPVLILAGRADRLARPEEARALQQRVERHSELIFFDRTAHEDLLDSDPDLYRRTVLTFIRKIKRRPG